MTEPDPYIRCIWEECLTQEIAHLHKAAALLWKYERKEYQSLVGDGTFPSILKFESNISYVRKILETTVGNTHQLENIVPLGTLSPTSRFFGYQETVNHPVSSVASHRVIDYHIQDFGTDYRYETARNPVTLLQNRTCDNTTLGRVICDTPERYSICGTTNDDCRCDFVHNC